MINTKIVFIRVFMHIITFQTMFDIISQCCDTYDFLKLVIYFRCPKPEYFIYFRFDLGVNFKKSYISQCCETIFKIVFN